MTRSLGDTIAENAGVILKKLKIQFLSVFLMNLDHQ